MKSGSYMTRAMQANDRRFGRILGKLGYRTTDLIAVEPVEDIADVRAEYLRVIGKRPYHRWDITTLRQKLAEARGS